MNSQISIELSDLFFNHHHESFDDLWNGRDADEIRSIDERSAMLEDARAFRSSYLAIIPELRDLDATDLAADYFRRR